MAPMTDEEYVSNRGIKCPFCESNQIEGASFEIDGACASQEVYCRDCEKSWWDVYELKGYEEMPER